MLFLFRLAPKAVWLVAEYTVLSLAFVANGQGVLLTNASPSSAMEVLAHPVLPRKNPVQTPTVISAPVRADPSLKTLEKIAEIRSLSPAQAA